MFDHALSVKRLRLIIVDLIPNVYLLDRWSLQPFNGQRLKMHSIFDIASRFHPDVCIETGTYLGSTTPYLATLANITHTFEISEEYANIAEERLQNLIKIGEVNLIRGSSAENLPILLSNLPKHKKVLAYLDAHWLDALPLNEELMSLINWGGAFVAVIDDFKVPSDPDYGYDTYGKQVVGIELLTSAGVENLYFYVPSIGANRDTGNTRGTCYVFNLESRNLVSPEILNYLQEIKYEF